MNRPDVIESRPDAPPGRAKVLLVDDHPVNLMALAELLRRDDAELLRAESGAEALELLLVHDVALALIDVQMPEMDGFELAELMRGVERAKYVPIILSRPACVMRSAGSADTRRERWISFTSP